MKQCTISATQRELLAAVKTATKGVTGRSSQPVQNALRLAFSQWRAGSPGTLTLTGTDLEVLQVTTKVIGEGSGDSGAEVAIAPKPLAGALSGYKPGAVVTLTLTQDALRSSVTVGGRGAVGDVTLPCYDGGDFGVIPVPEGEMPTTFLQVSASDWQEAFSRVTFACGQDQTRPMLTGVLLQDIGEGLRVIATDTYRLSVHPLRTGDAKGRGREGSPTFGVILPSRFVAEVGKAGGEVKLAAFVPPAPQKGKVMPKFRAVAWATVNGVEYTCGLIEGQFPAFAKVLVGLDANAQTVKLTEEARDLLLRLTKHAQAIAPRVKVVFVEGEEGEVRFLADDYSVQPFVAKLGVRVRLTQSFNPKFLSQVLGLATGDVTLRSAGQLNTALVQDSDRPSWQVALNPLILAQGDAPGIGEEAPGRVAAVAKVPAPEAVTLAPAVRAEEVSEQTIAAYVDDLEADEAAYQANEIAPDAWQPVFVGADEEADLARAVNAVDVSQLAVTLEIREAIAAVVNAKGLKEQIDLAWLLIEVRDLEECDWYTRYDYDTKLADAREAFRWAVGVCYTEDTAQAVENALAVGVSAENVALPLYAEERSLVALAV